MIRAPRTRSMVVSVVAVVLGGVAAVLVPATGAVAFHSQPQDYRVELPATATLLAKGAAVSVPVEVTCPHGQILSVDVTLTQRAGRSVISGNGASEVDCTGEPQIVDVNVVASPGSSLFRQGTAFAEASLGFCRFCGSLDTDSGEIAIKR